MHEIMLGALWRQMRTDRTGESVAGGDNRDSQPHEVDIPGVQPLSPVAL